MPLKTCHNIEAAYPPTQKWRHLRLRRSRTWAVCLPLSPQKGDHPPSHDDKICQNISLSMTAAEAYSSQVEAARNPEKEGLYSDLPTPR